MAAVKELEQEVVKEEQAIASPKLKKVIAPNGLRETGKVILRVSLSNSRQGALAVLPGSTTSIGVPIDPKTGRFNLNGQTPEMIEERYPVLSKQILVRTPLSDGKQKLTINNEALGFDFNLNPSYNGLVLDLENERDRFWASIIENCPEISPGPQAMNNNQRFHILDTQSEAKHKVGKGRIKHEALTAVYALTPSKAAEIAILFGIDPESTTMDEQIARLQKAAEDDPEQLLLYINNEEQTSILIDVKKFVLNRLITVNEYNVRELNGLVLGDSDEEAAQFFAKAANQQKYLALKSSLKTKLLRES